MTMTTKELLALVGKATPGPWEWINSNTDEPFDFEEPWDGGGYPSLRTVEYFGENKTEVRDGGTYSSFALPKWILDAEPMQNGNDAANAALIVAAVNALPALCAEVEALKAENERAWTAANRANAKVRGWESTMVCTGLPTLLFPVDGWGPGADGTVEIPQLTTEKLTSILDRLAAIDAAKEPK